MPDARPPMRLDVHVNQGLIPWEQVRDCAIAAEEAGFGTFWVLDHISGRVITSPTMREAFTLLGALAVTTSRIHIGPLVANVANRHAGMLAASAATVQDLSGGRLELGLGAGTSPASRFSIEHVDAGIPLLTTIAERHARFAEVVGELGRLWSDETSPEGFPKARPIPPMIVGANSVGLATVAGRLCDGININAAHPKRTAVLEAARAAHVEARGADAPWISSVWTWWDPELVDPTHPLRVELEAQGVDRLIMIHEREADPAAIAAVRVPSR